MREVSVAVSLWGVDVGLGTRRGAGSDKRSDASSRRDETGGAAAKTVRQCVSPPLRQEVHGGQEQMDPEVLSLVGGGEDEISGSADRDGRVPGRGETSGGACSRSRQGDGEGPFELEFEASGGILDGASWGVAADRDVAGDGAR